MVRKKKLNKEREEFDAAAEVDTYWLYTCSTVLSHVLDLLQLSLLIQSTRAVNPGTCAATVLYNSYK